MRRSALPLARYQRFRTSQVDEARSLVAEELNPHQLSPLSTRDTLDARFHTVRLGGIGLSYLDYAMPMRVAPRMMETFHLVQIPLAGRAEVISGTESVMSDPTLAAMPSPVHPLLIHKEAHNPHLIVWLDRDAVEQHLAKMLGHRLDRPPHFRLGMDLTCPAVRAWRGVVDLLVRELDEGTPDAAPLAMTELGQLLLSRLLLAQPGTHTEALNRDPGAVAPRLIRRAQDLIEERAHEPLTVADVAEAVGIGVRALQEGFRRYLDTTPMTFLRTTRLRRAAQDLAAADPATVKVTDVATRWGFAQLGRFSVQYRELIGESPSATLRS